MFSYWLTFVADIRTRPDITDVTDHLQRGTSYLLTCPGVTNAGIRPGPTAYTLAFDVRIRALTPDFALLRARQALHTALPQAGISTSLPPPGAPLPAIQVRLDSWPDSISPG